MRILTLALLLSAAPALADELSDLGPPLTGPEFEAYATGKTLTYSDGGPAWGQEQYLPGRAVIWAFEGAECQYGTWEEVAGPTGPMLCFTYDDMPEDANCWQFYRGPSGLVAQFMEGGSPLSELGQTEAPMNCPGPALGV